MRKFTYWVAHRLDDSRAYSIRSRRLGRVKEKLEQMECKPKLVDGEKQYVADWGARFSEPKKVTVEYVNTMHLISSLLGEDGDSHEFFGD